MKENPSHKTGFHNPRFLLAFLCCSLGLSLAVLSFTASAASKGPAKNQASFKPVVIHSAANGISLRVSDLPLVKHSTPTSWESHPPLPIRAPFTPPQLPVHDAVQQTIMGAVAMAAPIQTFEGMNQADGCGSCIPPDPNGAVGPNHYVEMVNSSYSVYSKTGTRLVGPVDIQNLFTGLTGSRCAATNDGDPVVVYDHLADRWVLSEFSVNGGNGPFAQCIAVSTSPDPTGSFYVYDFDQNVFDDYPKLGVWPDAYYMTSNEFGGAGGTFSGAGAFAFERAKMLAGQPAREVYFQEGLVDTSFGGQLPTHLDGPPPPAGAPNYFAEVDSQINTPALGADALRIWQFHVDWTNPANSTFGLNGQPNSVLPVAMWTPAQCTEAQGTCVQQLGSPYTLDVLGDRLMFRMTYRNFGDHEALLLNHSVVADVRVGVRWYEVRSPGSSPAIYQQGTFAPTDTLHRWMGSIAMDQSGDIGLAYSTSSAATYPSLAYTGRLPGDPLGQMGQGETQMFAGLGAENVALFLPPVGRWGDYSDLTVDPVDGCTFWYVNEYFGAEGTTDPGAPWRTRIGSFKFPQCTSTPVTLNTVVSRKTHGGAGTFDINLPLTGTPGIECRTGGANGDHTIVFNFAVPVTFTTADCGGTSAPASLSGNSVIVNCTAVPNALTIQITVHGVSAPGFATADFAAPMGVLAGDTNADRSVNSADISQTKSQSGTAVTGSNFREDVTVDGNINSADIGLVKSKSGTALSP